MSYLIEETGTSTSQIKPNIWMVDCYKIKWKSPPQTLTQLYVTNTYMSSSSEMELKFKGV